MSDGDVVATTETGLSADAFADANRDSFRDFYERKREGIGQLIAKRIGYRADWEDLCQDVFAEFYCVKGAEPDLDCHVGLLYAIARKRILDYYRRAFRRNETVADLIELSGVIEGNRSTSSPEESDVVVWHEDLRAAIQELPPKIGQVVVYRFLWGLDVPEISKIVGVSARTVERYIAKGRKLLKPVLAQDEEEATP